MNFENFLSSNRLLINNRLEDVLKNYGQKFGKINPKIKNIFTEFKKAAADGKRIRGTLVLVGFEIGGGNLRSRVKHGTTSSVLDAAVAFEIFQTVILAQDDIIDKSLMRRGKPSLYNALGNNHKSISQTICLSDLGFFISYQLIAGLSFPEGVKVKAIDLFSTALADTVLGQMLDIELSGNSFKEAEVLKIGSLKTAQYSFAAPLAIGAMLAGGSENLVKNLEKFGTNLGIAFQIQDDILGLYGDPELTGKSTDSDIREGKATLLLAWALKKSKPADLKKISHIYGNPEATDGEVEIIRQIIKKTGAFDHSLQQAAGYFKRAEESLKGMDERVLYSLLEFIKNRQK